MISPEGARWARAASEVLAWIEARDWAGSDPFDLLRSPLAAPIRRLRWPAVAWVQLGRRSPLDVRPLLGVRPHVNPKALALGLQGSLALGRAGDVDAARRAAGLVERLVSHERPGGGWGYPFAWANRHFRAPAYTPSSVVTAFVGHALLDAHDAGIGGPAAADAAVRGAAFVEESLHRIPHGAGFLFSYTPRDRRGVHNASMLAASLLARAAGAEGGREEWTDLARGAATATLAAQEEDGSWPYGLSGRDAFVDSFHTGYVLDALTEMAPLVPLEGTERAVRRGLAYWRDAFLGGPAVGPRPGVPGPVDLHAVAQAILTCLRFADAWPEGGREARRLAGWALDHARRPDGAFVYLWRPRRPNRIAYLRWVQAWMFRALAELAAAGATSG